MSTRILLVDDHETMRGMLRNLLSRESDMEVVGQAADGLAAIRSVESLAPDVVLMDVRMPELDGIEATRRILAAFANVKVIGLSMYADKAFVEAMLGAGASGYLLKDSILRELARAIRAVVGGGTYLDPDLLLLGARRS